LPLAGALRGLVSAFHRPCRKLGLRKRGRRLAASFRLSTRDTGIFGGGPGRGKLRVSGLKFLVSGYPPRSRNPAAKSAPRRWAQILRTQKCSHVVQGLTRNGKPETHSVIPRTKPLPSLPLPLDLRPFFPSR
jgi:hypothetical protein